MLTRTTDDWIQSLQYAGVPAVPLKSLKDLMHDPHLEEVGFFESRTTKEGNLRFPGIPTRFSRTPGMIREAGPLLGEHSVEVLQEAGFSDSQIESWLASGVVKDAAGAKETI